MPLLRQTVTCSRPVEDGPQVVLQDRALQRISHRALGMAAKKFVKARDRTAMRITDQQVPGLLPQQWIERFYTVLGPVGALPYKQAAIGPVPDVIRFRIEDRWDRPRMLRGG